MKTALVFKYKLRGNYMNYNQYGYNNNYYNPTNNYPNNHCPSCNHENKQKHVHEVQGSVQIAEPTEEPHNHRFCTVSGEAIPCGNNDHVHNVAFRTDFYEDHYHEFCGRTGGAIPVGDRHVHFLESVTTVDDGHKHKFRVATLIENPIGDEC
ncbi:MAG: hypothetical protein K0S47_4293 [Herbinix sp.]|jgi:hypothetical protein|nr:hypothetical protein [Herbinix sp.]